MIATGNKNSSNQLICHSVSKHKSNTAIKVTKTKIEKLLFLLCLSAYSRLGDNCILKNLDKL